MSPFLTRRIGAVAIGVVLVGSGAFILGPPLVERIQSIAQTHLRGNQDSAALSQWRDGGSSALEGGVSDASSSGGAVCTPGGGSSSAFARVEFTGVIGYDYSGVAGDGTWDMLHDRSMVHYKGTPAPGQKGNVIIAFHREPNYEHIDQLDNGGTVTIEDHNCHVYVYKVTQRWELAPDQVTQLNPTSGYNLTLVTCTPFWQDYNRFVWRGALTSVDGQPFHA